MAFGDDGLTKKETALQLSLWCARRDLKASHGLHPAIHRLTKPSTVSQPNDLQPTRHPKPIIASFAICSTHMISPIKTLSIILPYLQMVLALLLCGNES